ncbi:MAG TPA: hypothetical protein VN700_06665 [Vicinamibacterales bacterium]|nr:hypothetical protein [Vicinamibacterales bacterium]
MMPVMPLKLMQVRAAIAGLLMLAAAAPAAAQIQAPTPAATAPIAPGLIWYGKQSGLGLADVATITAPVLWFSTEEPLILQGERSLPHPHPCDAPSTGGVVYYQVTRIKLRSGVRVGWPPQDDPFFVDHVDSFTIRYHFYFRRHFGSDERAHDLAAADLDVAIDHLADGGNRIRVTRVAGMVRGTEWYANELSVEAGTRLPVTILIEQGTHATGPDRNADGLFTVGHDINRRTGDAWGIRDLEAGVLMAGKFDVSMFKPRQRGYRILPPYVERNAVDGTSLSSVSQSPSVTNELGRYELRAASNVAPCNQLPADHRTLRLLMRDQHFGPEYEPVQFKSKVMSDIKSPFTGIDPLIRNFSWRKDRTQGGAILFRGINFHDGSLMPRVTFFPHRGSIEGLYTPSGARAMSWYVSAGGEVDRGDWVFAAETGLKLRARIAPRKYTLGAEFIGFRVGIRGSGFDRIAPIRWILEVGLGGW